MPLKLITSGGGSVILDANTTGSTFTLTAPARNGTLITTGDSGTITQGMLASGAARANFGAGAVLQVVNFYTNSTVAVTTDTWTATPVTASITPSSSTNKILVLGQIFVVASASTVQPTITLYRNGSVEPVLPSYGFGNIYSTTGGYMEAILPIQFLSSPASTSSQTYTIYGTKRGSAGTANFGDNVRLGTITLLEIAA